MEGTLKDAATKLNDGKFDDARAKNLALHQAAICELRQNTFEELSKIESYNEAWMNKCNATYNEYMTMPDYGRKLDKLVQQARHVISESILKIFFKNNYCPDSFHSQIYHNRTK